MKKNRIVCAVLAIVVLLAVLLVRERPDAATATVEPQTLSSIVRPVLVAHSTVAERRARRVKEKLPHGVAIARFEELERETFARLPANQVEAWPQDDDAMVARVERDMEAFKESITNDQPIYDEAETNLAWLKEQIGQEAADAFLQKRADLSFANLVASSAESDRELGIVRNRNTNSLQEWMASGEIIRVDGPKK